ncbi:MAG: heme exporter protein CcmD [Silicimonas sp.]|nr:heme exporter protein CcmD [Silicimonas sp.]MBT8424916.1 heme exporter protein CcmD [Silicimonas sp.]NND43220.1 heme exporter protein CcmD [Silicimonas sp.]NNF90252.1 heme exporter protein CcmD [Boseongicola sp.]RZW00522.1 MAG: heme exporter protein CcmD [Paracoccaceae bacterium]
MMPDLGRYAVEVALAYGATLVLLAGLIVLSVWQSRRVKRGLDRIESRSRDG